MGSVLIPEETWKDWEETRMMLLNSKENETLRCDNCNDCTEVLNLSGQTAIRLCVPGKQLISPYCKTRPKWCNKEISL